MSSDVEDLLIEPEESTKVVPAVAVAMKIVTSHSAGVMKVTGFSKQRRQVELKRHSIPGEVNAAEYKSVAFKSFEDM